jgi:hypothetical protein
MTTVAEYIASPSLQLANRAKTIWPPQLGPEATWREMAEDAFREAAARSQGRELPVYAPAGCGLPMDESDYAAPFAPESRVLHEETEAHRRASLRTVYSRGRELLGTGEPPLTLEERITGLGYAGMTAYQVAAIEDVPATLVEVLRRSEDQHPDIGPHLGYRQRGTWVDDESDVPDPGRAVSIWFDDGTRPARKPRKLAKPKHKSIRKELRAAGLMMAEPEVEILEDEDAYSWCSAITEDGFDGHKYEISPPVRVTREEEARQEFAWGHLRRGRGWQPRGDSPWLPAVDLRKPKRERPRELGDHVSKKLRKRGYTTGGSVKEDPRPPDRTGKGIAPDPELGRRELEIETGKTIEALQSLCARGGTPLTQQERLASRGEILTPALVRIRASDRARSVDLAAALLVSDRSVRRLLNPQAKVEG